MSDSVDRLYEAVLAAKHEDPAISRTSRLLNAGRAKMAKKLGEEAFEVVIDALHGNREAVVWVASGVDPKDVWKEMDRRERLFGIAEKLLKASAVEKMRPRVAAVTT